MAKKTQTTAQNEGETQPETQTETKPTATSTQPPAQSEQQAQPQQLIVHAQYIKDFSFENPALPDSVTRTDKAPDIKINVNVSTTPHQQEGQPEGRSFEVVLAMRVTATRDETQVFLVELAYAAMISVGADVAENIIRPMVMIEGPRMLFPFARMMLTEITQSGGYMPLNIQPIDFVRLYQAGMESRAANGSGDNNGAGDNTPAPPDNG